MEIEIEDNISKSTIDINEPDINKKYTKKYIIEIISKLEIGITDDKFEIESKINNNIELKNLDKNIKKNIIKKILNVNSNRKENINNIIKIFKLLKINNLDNEQIIKYKINFLKFDKNTSMFVARMILKFQKHYIEKEINHLKKFNENFDDNELEESIK